KDAAAAHDFNFVALRYFNVAGADPAGRTGLSTDGATHLLKVACEAALGQRSGIEVYGSDYPTPDGTGIRDYIHVSDLVNAHLMALRYLRNGGKALIANCGYGRGYSVLEVLETVKRVSGQAFSVTISPRRPGDAASVVANSELARDLLDWVPRHDDLELIVKTALAWEHSLVERKRQDLATIQERLASAAF
ncbi:MAG TPA: NAD-dependent epimerase/dehydratase family protein, partial [Pseudorhizobium sp.]|nr:NAD-dependent epimerase/dehydratase family protein [Pseudorhizobium sp.]